MKISLNWIFDHIKGELSRIDVAHLVDTFIKTTAEIEDWKKVTINVDELALVEVTDITDDGVVVHCVERKKDYVLQKRTGVVIGEWFMIVSQGSTHRWATSVIFGGTKDMMLPAIYCPENLRAGGWKSTIELEDYIVEVDNKSINSRPDLWGHRGLAREIAAILNVQLRPLEEFITEKNSIDYKSTSGADQNSPFAITIEASQVCDRFATLYIPSVVGHASHLNMMVRLSRLDSRSIDFLVDATNYVMLDVGQPMHAFDADMLQTKQITIVYARDKEKLTLLDGETVELTGQDLVIADGNKAISLAGVMGGAITGISQKTKSVLLEAAHFDPVVIRRTASRHKKRTEASMRFEKSLDPCQNTNALKRFLFLLDRAGISYSASERIVSLGECTQQKSIVVEHSFIELRLGVAIKAERIVEILEKIEFKVVQSIEDGEIVYTIRVPSFRATKDIKIPEDIVEEVGRYIGYDTLPRVMPSLQLRPLDLHKTYTTRTIKRFCSYGLQMRELYGYSFFDESVLRELGWQPTDFVAIKNPISENYTRLVTTLQPHLLKAVSENSIAHTQLRFYEWGRVWHMRAENITEQKSLSGIFFDASTDKMDIDFYVGKEMLTRMFDELHMEISWQPSDGTNFSWMTPHQTAVLVHNRTRIGIAGMVENAVVNAISPAGGSVFMFEVNADYLLDYRKPLVRFNPLSKYPSVRRDVSILISVTMTTDVLTDTIKAMDERIESVVLIDFFTKSEWKDQKAMTFRVEMCDKEKTLTSDEVEEIWNRIVERLQQQGAIIR